MFEEFKYLRLTLVKIKIKLNNNFYPNLNVYSVLPEFKGGGGRGGGLGLRLRGLGVVVGRGLPVDGVGGVIMVFSREGGRDGTNKSNLSPKNMDWTHESSSLPLKSFQQPLPQTF